MKTLLPYLITAAITFGFMFKSYGQTAEFIVHFDIDQHQILPQGEVTLDQMLDHYKPDTTARFTISGHTDGTASEEYNQALSERRCKAVTDYLVSKGIASNQIGTQAFGELKPIEDNESIQGRASNRRVTITLYWNNPSPPRELVIETTTSEEPDEEPCQGDTVITFPGGTKMSMDKCEYLEKKDCISLHEYNSHETIADSGWTTITDEGDPLVSGGMFEFKTCNGGCLDNPIRVLLPVQQDCQGNDLPMSQWTMNAAGAWGNSQPLNIERIGDQRYYVFEVRCPGRKNADYKPKKPPKAKIKTKDGLKIIDTKILASCPLGQYTGKRKKWRKNIAKVWMPCPNEDVQIYCKAVNKDGEIVEMQWRHHEKVDVRESFHACREQETIKKVLWVFKVKDKTLYRKYVLFEEDFSKLKENTLVEEKF